MSNYMKNNKLSTVETAHIAEFKGTKHTAGWQVTEPPFDKLHADPCAFNLEALP